MSVQFVKCSDGFHSVIRFCASFSVCKICGAVVTCACVYHKIVWLRGCLRRFVGGSGWLKSRGCRASEIVYGTVFSLQVRSEENQSEVCEVERDLRFFVVEHFFPCSASLF